jgi:hypothetical protein
VLRSFNDWSGWRDDAERTAALKPFTLRLINSLASPEIEVKRALQAADWGLREKLAEVCEIVELPDHAATLRALAPLTGAASIRAATPAINRAALAALAALAARAARDARDARDARAARDARDARDARAALDARDAEYEAARKRRIQDACALIERMLAVTA